MDVFDLYAKLSLDSSEYDRSLQNAKDSADKWATKFAIAAKVIGATVNNVGKGIAGVVGKSIDAYGEYEQLVGGAKKIFDDMDYSKIAKDAFDAYGTMNLSASQYLSMMNSVGATFAQTMGDEKGYDTAKAGMQAIADYSSGTGRSVEELSSKFALITRSTSSYQSIADQFAGILPATSKDFLTQAKAAGLLSEKYTELTQVPIAEYQEAVSGMLKKGVADMGLASNTAMETAHTLTGSLAGMKTSWQNVLSTMVEGGENFDRSIQSFADSVVDYTNNLTPAIEGAMKGFSSLVDQLAPVFAEKLPELVEDTLPGLADAAVSVFSALADNLPIITDVLIKVIPSIIEKVANAIVKAAPNIIAGLIKLAATIAKSLPKAFSSVIKGFPKIFTTAFEEIGNLLPGVGEFFKNIFDDFFSKENPFSGLKESFEGIDFGKLGSNILKGLSSIFGEGGNLIFSIFKKTKDKVSLDISWGDVGKSVVNGMKSTLTAGADIIEGLGSALSSVAENINWDGVGEIVANGINAAAGIANGLLENTNWNLIGKTAADAINGVYTTLDSTLTTINWSLIGQTFGDGVNSVFTSAKSFINETDWNLIGKTAADAINGAYTSLDSTLTSIDWNLIGQTFGENVNGVFTSANSLLNKTDWELIGSTGANAINGVYTTLNSTLTEIDWAGIGQSYANKVNAVFDIDNGFFDSVNWSKIGKTGATALNGAFETINSTLAKINFTAIGESFASKINAVFDINNGFYNSTNWSKIGETAGEAITAGINTINKAIEEIDYETIGANLGSRINGIFENANKFLESGENITSGFANFFLGISGGVEQAGTNLGNILGNWIGGWGSSNDKETVDTNIDDSSFDLSTLSNLEPVSDDVIESYQALANAVQAINSAFTGQSLGDMEGGMYGDSEESLGLSAVLENLPDKFSKIMSAAQELADYFSGGFIEAIDLLKKALIQVEKNGNGETSASGGNTLYNALGEIFGVLEDILGTSKSIANHWKGEFVEAVNELKKAGGVAQQTMSGLSAAANTATGAFSAWAGAIQDVIAALEALQGMDIPDLSGTSGSFGGGKAGGGFVSAGTSYLVGEKGPEIYTPSRSGYIVPNDQLRGSGGTSIVINFEGDVIGDEASITDYVMRATRAAIQEEIYAGV